MMTNSHKCLLIGSLLFLFSAAARSDFLTLVEAYEPLNLHRAEITPDGKFLYAARYYSGYNDIAIFERDRNSGRLTFIEFEQHRDGADDGLYKPDYLSITPDGKHLIVTSYNRDSLAVYSINPTTGQLDFVDYHQIDRPSSANISPDGRYVVAASACCNYFDIYSRNPNSGLLSLVQRQDGNNLHHEFSDVKFDPQGGNLYVTDSWLDRVLVFNFNGATGEVIAIEEKTDGEEGVDGLNGAKSISISADGKSVYIASTQDFAVSVFNRSIDSGRLEYVEVVRDGVSDVEGLGGAVHVTTSPYGDYVYAVGEDDRALTVFQRNSATSRLSFVETHKSQDPDIGLIHDPRQSVVSPDGNFVYFISSHLIHVFRTSSVAPPPPTAAFQINAGLNGSWYFPSTDGQGFFLDVFPESKLMFVAWFTYDTEQPQQSVAANLGHPGQRWLTALGEYADNRAVLDIYSSEGGLFDMRPPAPTNRRDGTLTIESSGCNSGTVTYDIPSIGRQGVIPIERIVTENVPLCEALNSELQALQ
jgi:6-phosphogluconolactonase (cycloisomerase 2 family)